MHKPNFKNIVRDPYVIVSVITGVILLTLTLLFRVNPAEGSVVHEAIRGTFIHHILLFTTMPAYISAMVIGFAAFPFLFYPVMFLFQIIIYTFLGLLLRSAHRGIKHCLHPR